MGELVATLRRFGELDVSGEIAVLLIAMSPTTMHRAVQRGLVASARTSLIVSAPSATATARRVRAARGAISGWVSDHVRAGHAGSGQRHTRLRHSTRTDNPKHGASAARTTRRPCPGDHAAGHAAHRLRVGLHRDIEAMIAAVHVDHVQALGVEHRIGAGAPAHADGTPIVIHVGVSSADELGRYRSRETPTPTQRLRHAKTLNHA